RPPGRTGGRTGRWRRRPTAGSATPSPGNRARRPRGTRPGGRPRPRPSRPASPPWRSSRRDRAGPVRPARPPPSPGPRRLLEKPGEQVVDGGRLLHRDHVAGVRDDVVGGTGDAPGQHGGHLAEAGHVPLSHGDEGRYGDALQCVDGSPGLTVRVLAQPVLPGVARHHGGQRGGQVGPLARGGEQRVGQPGCAARNATRPPNDRPASTASPMPRWSRSATRSPAWVYGTPGSNGPEAPNPR